VQHPVLTKPPLPEAVPKPKEMYLTKEERKKLRRQRKQEAEKEKQEKIRMGLMAPPPPKGPPRAARADAGPLTRRGVQ
jgi:U4/U6 small nuclear ribonucleoprotein PRP3